MIRFLIFFLILSTPLINGVEQDSILNCDQFSSSLWNPYTWFDNARSELYQACTFILNKNIPIGNKKLEILSLYNPDNNKFNYDFVKEWNKDLNINFSLNVEGIEKINKTYIKNSFFKFTSVEPSVKLEDKKNTYIIPYNPNLKVDYGYEIQVPENQTMSQFPDLTNKGYCKEEYYLINSSGQFDLFVDKTKSIGLDLGKYIPLNLTEQGEHSLDGLYKIDSKIKADYFDWRSECISYDKKGNCIDYIYFCDIISSSQTLTDQVILTDYKSVSIEQPQMDILNISITGINKDLTARISIEGLNHLQRYNFNNWYVKTNYYSKLIYLYPPINYLQLLAIKNDKPRYTDLFLKKENNTFIFKTTPNNKNIFLDYNGFFFNNTIKANLSYKHFSYVDLVFDNLWYSYGDNVTVYPYILRNETYCKNCEVVLDKLRINYYNESKMIDSNDLSQKSSVSFIYTKDVDCISVYYQGDENHYGSEKCFKIPLKPKLIDYFFNFYWMFIGFSILALIVRYMWDSRK